PPSDKKAAPKYLDFRSFRSSARVGVTEIVRSRPIWPFRKDLASQLATSHEIWPTASCGVTSRTAVATERGEPPVPSAAGDVRHDQRTPTRAAAAMRSLPSSHSEGCCLPFTV